MVRDVLVDDEGGSAGLAAFDATDLVAAVDEVEASLDGCPEDTLVDAARLLVGVRGIG